MIRKLAVPTLLLVAALLAPRTASAGAVWVDGNYYAECPPWAEITSVVPDTSSSWQDGFAWGQGKIIANRFAWAEVSIGRLFCHYSYDQISFSMPVPSDFPNCTAYNGAWFICVR